MKKVSDRPKVLYLCINAVNELRLREILYNIPRKGVIKGIGKGPIPSAIRYKVKIKQRELLMIQLSLTEKIEVHRCPPAPYNRSPFRSAFVDLNDIPE